ncbi:MAG: 6-phosphofructokinase [Bacteroidota bacterium]
MNSSIKTIGVFTSGGDAPGMNAAIRAVVRTAKYCDKEVKGIYRGYEGMIDGEFIALENHSVSNIIQRGGTFIKTARSERFQTPEGRKLAYENLKRENIDALVAIGGDGTFRGALAFMEEYPIPILGVPGTIDNDLFGTDFTIGYDTAINTVVEAVDKIRDTAGSHDMLFFIEVMGRDAGFIALRSGIAVGAEDILVPESVSTIEELVNKLSFDRRNNKTSGIIIVSEGEELGGAYKVAELVKERYQGFQTRVTVLGHIQRGGNPSCMDRVLASTLGYEAVIGLLHGKKGAMVGQINNQIVFIPFEKATKHHPEMNKQMMEMARILSL